MLTEAFLAVLTVTWPVSQCPPGAPALTECQRETLRREPHQSVLIPLQWVFLFPTPGKKLNHRESKRRLAQLRLAKTCWAPGAALTPDQNSSFCLSPITRSVSQSLLRWLLSCRSQKKWYEREFTKGLISPQAVPDCARLAMQTNEGFLELVEDFWQTHVFVTATFIGDDWHDCVHSKELSISAQSATWLQGGGVCPREGRSTVTAWSKSMSKNPKELFCFVRNHILWLVCKCSLQSSAAAKENYLNWDLMAQSMESLPHKHRHQLKCLFLEEVLQLGAGIIVTACYRTVVAMTLEQFSWASSLEAAEGAFLKGSSLFHKGRSVTCALQKAPHQISASWCTEADRGSWRTVNKYPASVGKRGHVSTWRIINLTKRTFFPFFSATHLHLTPNREWRVYPEQDPFIALNLKWHDLLGLGWFQWFQPRYCL